VTSVAVLEANHSITASEEAVAVYVTAPVPHREVLAVAVTVGLATTVADDCTTVL
jgi:hypothetical protein